VISIVRNITGYLAGKPRLVFLVDSTGSLLTAFFLFAVLRTFNPYVGMPETILTYLSAIAACLFIYSITCFLFLKANWTLFIRVISIANLLYCLLTTWLLIIYYPLLTIAGITYFTAEITIICGLVYIELKVAAAISKNRTAGSH